MIVRFFMILAIGLFLGIVGGWAAGCRRHGLCEDLFYDAGGEDAGEAVVEALVFVGEAEVIDA